MNQCESYLTLMMQVLDGEASQEEIQALHAHLSECEACRSRYESYLAVDAAVKSTEEEPPEQLTAAIMNSIRREKPQPGHWLRRYRFTAIAAVLALVVLVGAKVTRSVPSDASGAAADHMENAVTEDMVAAEEELEPQEAPMMAALQEAPAEAAPETAAEAPVPELAEKLEDGQNFGAAGSLEEKAAYGSEEGDASFWACTEAVRKAGYSGRVLYVKDASREDLERLFPDMTEIVLEGGFVVYEIQESDVETVQAQFSVPADYVSESDSEEHFFIYLAQ